MAFETFIHLYHFQGYFVINENPKKEFPFSCFDGDMNFIFRLFLPAVFVSVIWFCFTVKLANNTRMSDKNTGEKWIILIFARKCLVKNLDIILFVHLGSLKFNFRSHWIKKNISSWDVLRAHSGLSFYNSLCTLQGMRCFSRLSICNIYMAFPSCLLPLFENESSCETIYYEDALTLMKMKVELVLKQRHKVAQK